MFFGRSHFLTLHRILGLISILLICGLLTAGLRPFHAPQNEVQWLGNPNGLWFKGESTVLSLGTLGAPNTSNGAWSLEAWLRPCWLESSSTVLGLYTHENPLGFSLQQRHQQLVLKSEWQMQGRTIVEQVEVNEVFQGYDPVFLALTVGPGGTRIYRNGVLVKASEKALIDGRGGLGQLVLGTSAVENNNWTGHVFGLAVFRAELSRDQVLRHGQSWTQKGQPLIADHDGLASLYLFDERGGRVAHDRKAGVDLILPERFTVVDQLFLEPPWKEFRPTWGYLRDVLINIGGFVPFGLCFCAFLVLGRGVRRASTITTLTGTAISCTIEVVQHFLPTRHSGVTDLFTNTLGTWIGVVLFIRLGRLARDRGLSEGKTAFKAGRPGNPVSV